MMNRITRIPGLRSGCYPFDEFYKDSPEGVQMNEIKNAKAKVVK